MQDPVVPDTLPSIGPYSVKGVLGRGGMGVVFLAQDTRLGRDVAIKTLPPEVARDPDRQARFHREARLLASLNHANLATIHGFEETPDGGAFLIMERVVGQSLAERLNRGPLPLEEALPVAAQIAAALEAAHENHVIHCDLKPGNVMVTPRGRVKVLDFGLAREVSSRPGDKMDLSGHRGGYETSTSSSRIMGTLGYMSVEQLRGEPLDARSDLFAFGCVLYECLTGSRAFPGKTPAEAFHAVTSLTPDWSLLPESVPGAVRDLLSRCLRKQREEREADAGAVRREIESILGRPSSEEGSRVARAPNNLPTRLSRFVGREQEIRECVALMDRSRLVTVCGTGGGGKTRLAIAVGARLLHGSPGGVWLVDLAPIADPDRVAPLVTRILGGPPDQDGQALEALRRAALGKKAVVILDNCEHLLEAAGRTASALLDAEEEIRVLATSREMLHVPGEAAYRVPPLSLPEPGAEEEPERILESDAVKLFVERARLVHPEFDVDPRTAPVVADVCRRLDGIPLAIELAAMRVRLISIEEIRERLRDRFQLLRTDALDGTSRHQTLRAAIQWSYDSLHEDEKRFFRRLAVFAGGWTLAGAMAVHGETEDEYEALDLMTRLVDKSLVVVDRRPGGATRYRLLETIREFAAERLRDEGEEVAARERHLRFFRSLALEAKPRLIGPEQPAWVERLTLDHENLLAAMEWCHRGQGGAEANLELAAAIWRFWEACGHFTLGCRVMEAALERDRGRPPSLERAQVLEGIGLLSLWQGDFDGAERNYSESLELGRLLGDELHVARSLNGLGAVLTDGRGRHDEAVPLMLESLAISRKHDDKIGTGRQLSNLGAAAMRRGDYAGALPLLEEALAIRRAIGNMQGTISTLANLGQLATRLEDFEGARLYFREAFGLAQGGVRYKGIIAALLGHVAELAYSVGDDDASARFLGAAQSLREAIDSPMNDDERTLQEPIARALEERDRARFLREQGQGMAWNLESTLAGTLGWLEGKPFEDKALERSASVSLRIPFVAGERDTEVR